VQEDPAQALDTLVEQVRAALGGSVPEQPQGPFAGEAADGRVRAEVDVDGRLRELHLDPKVLREPLDDVAAAVVVAVNAALDARPARANTGPLLEQLRSVQEESVVQMARITEAFTAALERVRTRG
jgi:DNA-binding protein YbaB